MIYGTLVDACLIARHGMHTHNNICVTESHTSKVCKLVIIAKLADRTAMATPINDLRSSGRGRFLNRDNQWGDLKNGYAN